MVEPWGRGRTLGWQSHPALGFCPARPGGMQLEGWGGPGRAGQVEGQDAFK